VTVLSIPDDELEREALAADPDAPIPAGAISWWEREPAANAPALLPDWYMPAPAAAGARRHPPWRRRTVYGLVGTFLLINAAGLCSTYGFVVIA
jgi:hypothetical protein